MPSPNFVTPLHPAVSPDLRLDPEPAPEHTQAPPHPNTSPSTSPSGPYPRFESPGPLPVSPCESSITRAFFGRSPRRRRPHSTLSRASSFATLGSGPPTRSCPSPFIPRHRSGTVATAGSNCGGAVSSTTSSHRLPQSHQAGHHQISSDSNPKLLFAARPSPRTANPSQQGVMFNSNPSVIIPPTTVLEDELGPLPSILPIRQQPIPLSQTMDPLAITPINLREDDDDAPSDEEAIVTDEEADLLEVVDPAVHTASTLGHIQNSLFLPVSFSPFGSPIIESPDPATVSLRNKPRSPRVEGERRSRIRRGSILIETVIQHHQLQRKQVQDRQGDQVQVQDKHPLDHHIMEIVEKQGQNQKLKRMVKGACAFLKTPLGILFGIYGFLVVFWGAALVLILLKWIKIEPVQKYRIWVEICSQILNGLFTIPGIGLLPSRLIDWWNIFVTIHYARIVWSRKGKTNLADPNEILPLDLERANAERLAATIAPSSANEASKRLKKHQPCQKFEDERRILSEHEIIRLERAQTKLCKSQTWYRPHSSPTHYAFPIWGAFVILACNLGNSLFQAALCGVMWGLTYSRRPAWTTATFMAASFSCGISSAFLIWLVGRKTQKSKEVMERVEEILKNGTGNSGYQRSVGLGLQDQERKELGAKG